MLQKAKKQFGAQPQVTLIKYVVQITDIEKAINQCEKYETKKAYWPNSQEHRAVLQKIYEAKGIPAGVARGKENVGSSARSGMKVKSPYQIGVAKVLDGQEVGTYQSYIKWEENKICESAAKRAGITLEEFLTQAKGQLVITKEINDIVGELPLLLCGSDQIDLLIRIYRYGQLAHLPGALVNLFDMAEDVLDDFDYKRETLLEIIKKKSDMVADSNVRNNIRIFESLKDRL